MVSHPTSWCVALARFVEELRTAYGERLEGVVLRGSRARRGARASGDSDIDTLIILDAVADYWTEFDRIAPIASRVSLEYDALISAFPASAAAFRAGAGLLLANARDAGERLT